MIEPALTQAKYRNKLERDVGGQLAAAGIAFEYEGSWVRYAVPAREAKYLPDFRVGNVIIEAKGWFGRNGARERKKLVLLKEQHPELNIRIVFSDARKPIYKGSPTTYSMWADTHGFIHSTKGVVPKQWLIDLKQEQHNVSKRRKRS